MRVLNSGFSFDEIIAVVVPTLGGYTDAENTVPTLCNDDLARLDFSGKSGIVVRYGLTVPL